MLSYQNPLRFTELPTLGEVFDGSNGVPPYGVAGETLPEVVGPPSLTGLNSILGLVVVRSWDHRPTGNLGS